MSVVREMRVALPDHAGDIYRRHQLVWEIMHGRARTGSSFVFAMLSPRTALLRSDRIERGTPAVPREGWTVVSIVTALRMPDGSPAMANQEAETYIAGLMLRHGVSVDHLKVSPTRDAVGVKPRLGSNGRIVLPVRDVLMEVRIADQAHAEAAWRAGVGRGKRFGYGMLRHVAQEAARTLFSNPAP